MLERRWLRKNVTVCDKLTSIKLATDAIAGIFQLRLEFDRPERGQRPGGTARWQLASVERKNEVSLQLGQAALLPILECFRSNTYPLTENQNWTKLEDPQRLVNENNHIVLRALPMLNQFQGTLKKVNGEVWIHEYLMSRLGPVFTTSNVCNKNHFQAWSHHTNDTESHTLIDVKAKTLRIALCGLSLSCPCEPKTRSHCSDTLLQFRTVWSWFGSDESQEITNTTGGRL